MNDEEIAESPEEEIIEEVVEVPGGEEQEIPAFMAEGDGQEGDQTVPVSAIVKVKAKLKAKLSESNEEIDRLRQEIDTLKQPKPTAEAPKRPRLADYASDAEFDAAMDNWEQQHTESTLATVEQRKTQREQAERIQQEVTTAVSGHYERAAKLVSEHTIDPEVYRAADHTVRSAVEAVMPKRGDAVVDQMISIIGEGSEKTLFHLGRNQNSLNTFRALLQDDPSGLKAAVFLGKKTAEFNGTTTKKISRAPAPAASATGDAGGGVKASAIKKQYDAAHKKGDTQAAFNLKRQAKAAGIDIKQW